MKRVQPEPTSSAAHHQTQGIRFHGLSIPDSQKVLPPAKGAKELIPESMLWLLLTGQVPSEQQTRDFSRQLAEKGELPKDIESVLDAYAPLNLIAIHLLMPGVDSRGTCTP